MDYSNAVGSSSTDITTLRRADEAGSSGDLSELYPHMEISLPLVKLQAIDGDVITASWEAANKSGKIKISLDSLRSGAGDSDPSRSQAADVVSLPEIRHSILQMVVDYAEYHKNDTVSSIDDDDYSSYRTDDIIPWDQEFFKVDFQTVFDLINAATYLDMPQLLDTACKVIANVIKGKTAEEIRATFNIENDFTPAEEEAIRKETEWCDDPDVRP